MCELTCPVVADTQPSQCPFSRLEGVEPARICTGSQKTADDKSSHFSFSKCSKQPPNPTATKEVAVGAATFRPNRRGRLLCHE